MPKLNNKEKLNKLSQALLAMDEYAVSKEDFLRQFKRLLEFLKKLKEKNQTEFTNLNQSISDLSNKLKDDNTSNISELKEELLKAFNKSLKEQEDGMNFIRDKVRRIKNGLDGKDGRDGKDGSDGKDAKIPPTKKILKSIKKKLKISDIKGLRKELNKKGVHSLSGGSGGIGGSVRYYDLSPSLNGVLKKFSLPAFARILSVQSSSFPNAFRETTDYTVDGSAFTIEFTSEITAGTTLATGQTITILYAQM